MGERVNRFRKKLTDEAAIYAVQRLACGITAKTIRDEIAQTFGIEITGARISMLTGTKRWNIIYKTAREQFLIKVGDYTGIALAAQRTRLQEGDHLREKLIKIINRLENRLDINASAKDQNILMKQLKDMMEVYLKVLQMGRTETKDNNSKKEAGNTGFRDFMKKLYEKPASGETKQSGKKEV